MCTRERTHFTCTGTYTHYAYGIASTLSEVPFNVVLATLFWVISYWLVGFNSSIGAIFTQWVFLLMAYIVLPSLGMRLYVVSPVTKHRLANVRLCSLS